MPRTALTKVSKLYSWLLAKRPRGGSRALHGANTRTFLAPEEWIRASTPGSVDIAGTTTPACAAEALAGSASAAARPAAARAADSHPRTRVIDRLDIAPIPR